MPYSTRSNRVALASIETLTFYADSVTTARRSQPISQLTCEGNACKLYQPDVVQCTNMGAGQGAGDVQWKCVADLPSKIRLGRVSVSCEGYEYPGDDYVLKGSCGLTYNLVKVSNLEDNDTFSSYKSARSRNFAGKFISNLFNAVTLCLVMYLAWIVVVAPILRYLRNVTAPPGRAGGPPRRPGNSWLGSSWGGGGDGGPGFGPGGGGGSGSGGSFFGSPPRGDGGKPDTQPSSSTAWRPGFLSGVAAGVAGEAIRRSAFAGPSTTRQQPQPYRPAGRSMFGQPSRYDRGEGSSTSDLGSIRQSTGFGGSSTR